MKIYGIISNMLQKAIEEYISSLTAKLKTGQAREHTYRPVLERYISALGMKAFPLNEPKHSEHGAPDFVFTRGDLILGYAETKDIGADLDKVEKSEQMERYLGYSNLILTDYLEFRFYKNGVRYGEPVRVGSLAHGGIEPNQAAYDELESALKDFLVSPPERIKSGKRLADIMGGKARRIRDNVRRYLASESEKNKELVSLYDAIRTQLVHDLKTDAFADMYAQTLVYGLFVARYDDDTPDTFSRREAGELIPASNPFLKSFFDHIAGVNFDRRLSYIVDELCDVFRVSNVKEIIEAHYENDAAVARKDQIIHFYEDFLKEYDEALRKKMGAYYTPLPVVRFIVRAVDSILKSEFKLTEGLANTSKLPNGEHRVQILDPAVGTGTFISEVIGVIYRAFGKTQGGRWPAYVHHELLPRLYGFELMMAPYTIAHLKLSLAFKQTGFKYFNETRQGKARLRIYLTNSLEQNGPQAEMFSLGFGQAIAEEAKQAAVVKEKTPIMVVLGNPPYSVSSSNKGEWIQNLIKDYKPIGERNIQPLSDDYIKFIRFAEHFVERNKSGVVAMITNNSFLDGNIHRQMRKHLLETFDDIYILDLHGNAKKKETAVDGSKDENVFDIQQGVAISILVRRGESKRKPSMAHVHFAEIRGTRELKFQTLDKSTIQTAFKQQLEYTEPNYFFTPKDLSSTEYPEGINLTQLFLINSTGIKTHRDGLVIDFDKAVLEARIEQFSNLNVGDSEIATKYELKDNRDWKLSPSRRKLADTYSEKLCIPFLYRPFDVRWIYFSPDVIDFDRREVMQHIHSGNLALVLPKQTDSTENIEVLATTHVGDHKACSAYNTNYYFPLRVQLNDEWVSNLNEQIITKLEKRAGKIRPEDVFDYIYAILHSPGYREKYKEFLKIDFPRVPYPTDKKQFAALAALGKELRELHLLESPKVRRYITSYDVAGSDMVEKITRKSDKVYINATQYFGDVPGVAWNFYIGGYQPAQKWLKDRKGRALTNEDIEHYQKMIVALTETNRVMQEIDTVMTA